MPPQGGGTKLDIKEGLKMNGKKRFTAMAAALSLLIVCIPNVVFSDASFMIYDTSFEDEKLAFDQKGGETEFVTDEVHSGSRAVRVSGYSEESSAPRISLSEVNKEAKSEISVWVRPELTEGKAKLTLLLFTQNEAGAEKVYTVASMEASGGWTQLSGKMFTKYMTMSQSPQIAVTAKSADGYISYLLDDLTVTSARAPAGTDNPPPDISYEGKYTLRAAFENNTYEAFTTKDTAEFIITDEVPAHTGRYSMKITHRTASDGTMMIFFPGAAKDAKISFSCWVRNKPGDASRNYTLQGIIPTAEGKKWPIVSSATPATDKGWSEVKGTIDCSKYKVTGDVGIQIVAGTKAWQYYDFYVDDILAVADCDGELYDDTLYVPKEQPENISASPSRQAPAYTEIQEDIPALQDVFKDYFKIGGTITNRTESDTSRYGRLLKRHFNTVVSDGLFKINEILKGTTEFTYTFTDADLVMDFANRNGLEMIGHALIWERSSAKKYVTNADGSYVDRDSALKFIKEYVTKIMKHFEGDGDPSEYAAGIDYSDWHLTTWDVVNEAVGGVNDDGSLQYRELGSWYNVLGPDYIDYTFKCAEETGYKDIALRYNDYGEQNENKCEAVYRLVKGLKERGRRVDIIGMQSHYTIDIVPSTVRRAIEKYLGLGVSLDVTELDLNAYSKNEKAAKKLLYEEGIPKEVEFTQATAYAELFKIYRQYAEHINRVNFWTFADQFAYENVISTFPRAEYAGIFDRAYQAKPQYWAIVDPQKYYSEILREDNSTLRVVYNSVQAEFKDKKTAALESDGVQYIAADELLDILGISYVKLGSKVSFIKDDVFYEIDGGNVIKRAFEDYTLNNGVIISEGKTYLPIAELSELLGYESDYNEDRNMMTISEKTAPDESSN